MVTWEWVEEAFEYDYDGTPRYDEYGPRCVHIVNWLSDLENVKGHIVTSVHFIPLENNYIVVIAKVEFPTQGKGDDNE